MPRDLEARLAQLEKVAHAPFDFTALLGRVERLETAASVALAAPAALHRAREAQYQYAKLAWEKIKENLRERGGWRYDHIHPSIRRDIDEEQIEAIRAHMGETNG